MAFTLGQWCIEVDALACAKEEVAADQRRIAATVPDRKVRDVAQVRHQALFPVLTDVDNGYAMPPRPGVFRRDEMKHMMANSGWDPPVSQAPTIGRWRFRDR